MRFEELDLSDNVLDALYDMRFEECTPVQEKCIPEILSGRDVLGVAQTGTGKTAAYLLPILSKLDDGGYPDNAVNCVIMSPTRELAQQIDQAMQGFAYYTPDVSSVAVYGGNDGNRYDQELKSMKSGVDVVIATPGRLISHISLGNVDLSKVSFFVLDEADRMLDMGFSDDIMKIASQLPQTCQTIMFSATMPKNIEKLAQSLLKDPVEVKLAVSKPAEKIQQSAYICYETQKLKIIEDIFKAGDLKRVIIFSGSKQKVKHINQALTRLHINSGEMHSDLDQAERDDMMFKFKSGQIDVLVATDILARGIDIDDIAMVINYDVPHDAEDYVHRIGRTARATATALPSRSSTKTICMLSTRSRSSLRRISRRIHCPKAVVRARSTRSLSAMARLQQKAVVAKTVTILHTKTQSALTAMHKTSRAHRASSATTAATTADSAETVTTRKLKPMIKHRRQTTEPTTLRTPTRATATTATRTDITATTAIGTTATARTVTMRLATVRTVAPRSVKARSATATTADSEGRRARVAIRKTAMHRTTERRVHKATDPSRKNVHSSNRQLCLPRHRARASAACCATH